jgi:hypothetical protein
VRWPKRPRATKESTPAKPFRVSSDKLPAAPQVVTIIHRLNGLKMFRLLLRSQQQLPISCRISSLLSV